MEDKQGAKATASNDWTQLEEEFANQHVGNTPTQSSKKVVKSNSLSAQETLPIAEIRDGVVILKDGSFKAVIKAEAVNFDLMSQEEREGIEYAYQAFLNSLYFPIQINVQSRRVDADVYVKKIQANLRQQNNMLLSALIEDYLGFVEDLIDNTDIMDKNFFIVIPFYNNEFTKEAAFSAGKNLFGKLKNFNKKAGPVIVNEKTLDKARRELRYRIQAVMEGLRPCGVQSRPLSTQELIKMYYEFYNPETTITRPLSNFEDITAPFVSRAGDYNPPETPEEPEGVNQPAAEVDLPNDTNNNQPESPPPSDVIDSSKYQPPTAPIPAPDSVREKEGSHETNQEG